MAPSVDVVTEIEEAFVGHWSVFGRWTHGRLVEGDGLVAFETPITHLPYNGVIRTRIDGDADRIVRETLARYRDRGVNLLWVVQPSSTPDDLGDRLSAHGLELVEHATGMSLELADWDGAPPSPDIEYREVLAAADMESYQALNAAYWELPDEDARLAADFQREFGPGRAPGHRYIAVLDGTPIGKGYLSLAAPPGVAGIYGMSTRPEARGRGVASGMTAALLDRAKALGCRKVVLHSSEMAVGVYRRMGFVEHCRFDVFATAPIWTYPR